MNKIKTKIPQTKKELNYPIYRPIIHKTVSICGGILLGGLTLYHHHMNNPSVMFTNIAPSIVKVSSMGFHNDPFAPGNMIEYTKGTGTGFSFKDKKYIVTNSHVINDAFGIKVTNLDGDELDAVIVGKDTRHDIAVLRINDKLDKFHPLQKCNMSAQVGQSVFAIGNPFGLDRSMSSGIISGIKRTLDADAKQPLINLLQTDAAINPGNSGGPLLDSNMGCILGMNTAIISPNGSSSGVGFAIPIDIVNNSVGEIINSKKHTYVKLGISLLPDKFSEIFDINGIIIASVFENGNAKELGLIGTYRDEYNRPIIGDIIIGIENEIIKTGSDLYRILDGLSVGDTINLKVLRSTGIENVKIKLD